MNKILSISLSIGLLSAALLCDPPARSWDGHWTQAASGKGDVIYDSGTSEGKAGTDELPQTFFIPPPRDAKNVDPEELNDYFHRHWKDYTPYALARVTQTIRYNGIQLPKGYYLIKPGDEADGSPTINLRTPLGPAPEKVLPPLSSPAEQTEASGRQTVYRQSDSPAAILNQAQASTPPLSRQNGAPLGQSNPISPTGAHSPAASQPSNRQPVYRVFVIKKLGNVIAVVPIHRVENYRPKRKEKIPRQALAWVAEENRHPVLKFYYRHKIYSTDFQ